MDRVDRRVGGVGIARARGLVLATLLAGLALSASAFAALPANVAVVAGKPIPRQQLDHWILISAKSQGGPLVVADDPPRFEHCIAQARAGLPSVRHDSTRSLRRDCRQLFINVAHPALDFLIRTDWDELEAASDGIVITGEQVDHAFAADRRQMFPKLADFRRFLRKTGQTVADIKFRVRGSLVFDALRKAEHLSERALEAELTRRFKTQTTCARLYVMSDCAGG